MSKHLKPIMILMADDDEDDRLMVKEAWEDSRLAIGLRFVEDGIELMDYLYSRGKYANEGSAPRPGLILLDLNMPKKNGFEALQEIKANPDLRRIPIIVLTTSKEEEDIFRSYDLGVSGFITKPVSLEGLAEVLKSLKNYWFEIVELPIARRGA